MLDAGGDTTIDNKVGICITSKFVLPTLPFNVALIGVVPTAKPVATPPIKIVALLTSPEVHTTELLIFAVDPSLYVPVAIKVCVAPINTLAFGGVTAIDTSIAGVTVTFVLTVMPLKFALITLFPALIAVTIPELLTTDAIAVVAELKVLLFVTTTLLPSV